MFLLSTTTLSEYVSFSLYMSAKLTSLHAEWGFSAIRLSIQHIYDSPYFLTVCSTSSTAFHYSSNRSAYPYGTPTVLSSYTFSNNDAGAPNEGENHSAHLSRLANGTVKV
jgi:hypothetical protein